MPEASLDVKRLIAGQAKARAGGTATEMRSAIANVSPHTDQSRIAKVQGAVQSNEYMTLERLQSHDSHNTVRTAQTIRHGDSGAYSQSIPANTAQETGLLKSSERAIRAADHTDNMTVNSGFVSLSKTMGNAQESSDLADSVARASHIHTYLVPKVKAVDATQIMDTLRSENVRSGGAVKSHLDTDGHRGYYGRFKWLKGTPSSEGEVLYEGNDLARHHIGKRENNR